MDLTVRVDVAPLTRTLDTLAQRQVPFATAQALTRLARGARDEVTRQLPSIFDKPTPFTLRGIAASGASKRALEARVFVKPVQAEYLVLEETGGVQRPKGKALVLPRGIRRNAYGNMPAKAFQTAKAQGRRNFVGTVRGVGGLWRKPTAAERKAGKGLRLLAQFVREGKHDRPRFKFKERVGANVRRELVRAFREELARAIATAK